MSETKQNKGGGRGAPQQQQDDGNGRALPSEPIKSSSGPSSKRVSAGRGNSSSNFKTLGPNPKISARMKNKSSTEDSDDSLSTSSSDFDIVVSDHQSVVTELTFDPVLEVPESTTRLSAETVAAAMAKYSASSKVPLVTKKAADNNYGSLYKPQRKQQSMHQPSSALPSGLPNRMPLYNGSEASLSLSRESKSTRSPNTSRSGTLKSGDLRAQDIHPSVEAFLASAMKKARMSRSSGLNDDDDVSPPLTDEEPDHDIDVDRRVDRLIEQQEQRRMSGGVPSSSDGASGNDRVGKQSPGRNRGKKTKSAKSQQRRDSMTSSNRSGSRASSQYFQSPAAPKSPSALLRSILAQSQHTPSRPTSQSRRESVQSFFSIEDESYSTTQGEDYVC